MPFRRSTAASPPGATTVLRNSWWSYWRHTHDLSAMVGDASSASSSPERSVPGGEARARAPARDRRPGSASRSAGGASGPVVHRAVAEARDRHVGDRHAVGRHLGRRVAAAAGGFSPGTPTASNRPSNTRKRAVSVTRPMTDAADLPPRAQVEHRVEVRGRDDREHALLALRRHHLDRVHARLALGHAGEVDVHARAGLRRGLRRRARDAGGAEVLHADRRGRRRAARGTPR